MEQGSLISVDFSMVIQMINFLVMVYVFYKLFSKKIGEVVDERKKIVLEDLEKAKIAKEEAEKQREEVEQLTKESKVRANEIVIKAERQADERKDQIISNANTSRDKMMANAEKEIIKMKSKAEIELQKEVGKLAVNVAEKLLKENISENVNLKTDSIDNFIAELGE